MLNKRNIVVAVDFDGTIVEDEWPNIGPLKPYCKEALYYLKHVLNCDIVIWTCRDKELPQAIEFLKQNNVEYDSINCNCPNIQKMWPDSPDCRKVFADIYIDDRSYHYSCGLDSINWIDICNKIQMFRKRNSEIFN